MTINKRNAEAIRSGIVLAREHAALYGSPGAVDFETESFYMTLNLGARTTKTQLWRRVAYRITYTKAVEKRLVNLTSIERDKVKKTHASEVRKTYDYHRCCCDCGC